MNSYKKSRLDGVSGYLFVLPALVIFMVFMCIPAFQSFYTSFTKWNGLGLKSYVGLQNYINIFTNDERFGKALLNNISWAIAGGTIPLAIGLYQANMLVRGKIKYANVFQLIFFLPQIICSVVAAIIWKWIYDPVMGPLNIILNKLGLDFIAGAWLGDPKRVMIALFVVYTWVSYGFCTVVFCAAIQSVDEQLYEAARMDGCPKILQFWRITLPCIRKTTTTVMLLMIIWSFQVFDLVYTMTQGGPGYSSYVMSYYVYYEGFIANRMGYATALSITLTVIILTFSLVFTKIRAKGDI